MNPHDAFILVAGVAFGMLCMLAFALTKDGDKHE